MLIYRSMGSALIAISQHWWAVILVVIANFASFGILFSLEDRFESLSGVPTFDTQNDLTAQRLLEQLALYSGEARTAYFQFAAFDFLFPLIAGLFVAVLWTLLLRLNRWKPVMRLYQARLFLLPLLTTLADWLENISLLSILNTPTAPNEAWVQAALTFKALKLLLLNVSLAGIVILAALLIYDRWLRARWTVRLAR